MVEREIWFYSNFSYTIYNTLPLSAVTPGGFVRGESKEKARGWVSLVKPSLFSWFPGTILYIAWLSLLPSPGLSLAKPSLVSRLKPGPGLSLALQG